MRVIHVVTRYRRGGAERNMQHFMAWQRDAGCDVTLIMGDTSLDDLVPDGVRAITLPSLAREPHPMGDVTALADLRRLLRRLDPWMVHTHESKAGILGRLASPRSARVVHTVHMPSFGPVFGRMGRVFWQMERLAARRTDMMLAVSDELRSLYLHAGIGDPDSFMVVPSPVRAETFLDLRTLPRTGAFRQGVGLPDQVPLVLSVGSLEPRKRHDVTIRALAEPLSRGSISLAIMGEGPDRNRLEELVDRLGIGHAVRLPGHCDAITEAYRDAQAFAMSSRTEGLAQVLVQALAAGLPVIATPVEGIKVFPASAITAVASDGTGMADAVLAALADPPPMLDPRFLTPWTTDAVEDQVAAFHDAMGHRVVDVADDLRLQPADAVAALYDGSAA